MTFRFLGVAAVAATIMFGCKGTDDDLEPAVVPKAVTFEGDVDSKYVGLWKSSDGNSTLDLSKEGVVKIDQKIVAANGKSTSHVEGTWLAKGDDLLFRYPERSGGETTLKYAAKLKGNTLVLGQSGGRLKRTYVRK